MQVFRPDARPVSIGPVARLNFACQSAPGPSIGRAAPSIATPVPEIRRIFDVAVSHYRPMTYSFGGARGSVARKLLRRCILRGLLHFAKPGLPYCILQDLWHFASLWHFARLLAFCNLEASCASSVFLWPRGFRSFFGLALLMPFWQPRQDLPPRLALPAPKIAAARNHNAVSTIRNSIFRVSSKGQNPSELAALALVTLCPALVTLCNWRSWKLLWSISASVAQADPAEVRCAHLA